MRSATGWVVVWAAVMGAIVAAEPRGPESNWPGFRGHDMSGVAATPLLPERWSASSGIAWQTEISGRGWSSPIVWNDVVYVTSAVGTGAFKQPSTGIYGNDYVAELVKQGLSDDEVLKRLRARDIESTDETSELRYMVYALDAKTGKVKWELEARRTKPFGGRHRKNTYASETPFTDGERLYVSFGQNVGLFCYTLDGRPLWQKQFDPHPIYLDFGTASSPTVAEGRVYLLHDSESLSYIVALDAKTGREVWRRERPAVGFPKSSWMTPFVWKHAQRTEIITTGHGFVIAYDLEGKELWRIRNLSMPIASPVAAHGLLYVGTGSQGDANRPLYAVKPGASGDITPADAAPSSAPGAAAQEASPAAAAQSSAGAEKYIAWMHPRASGYTPSPVVQGARIFLVHDTGILVVLDALSGKEIYKARVGGGGNTFSASPVAAGSRIYFLSEDGITFVLDGAADTYTEVARNTLDEMSLASPAAADGALYIRTASKLYKVGGGS
jgi:outer membrane protein assembly factor BamB